MKFLKLALIVAVLAPMIMTSCGSKDNDSKYSLSFEVPDSVAYSIGLSMGSYLQREGIRSIDTDEFAKGMTSGIKLGADDKSQVDSAVAKVQTFMVAYNQKMQMAMQADTTFQPEPMDLPKDISHNFGILLGSNLIEQNLDRANTDKLVEGVKDQFGNAAKVTAQVSGTMLENYFKNTDSLRIDLNEQFVADNKEKSGVITTPSGLQYTVVKKGDGKMPEATDKVKVNYKGTFINGKTFDSSYDRGEPAEFLLNQVVPGWTEGIALMPVGSEYEFVIPFDLAYGEQGSRSIPPKSTLIFKVELLEILPAAPQPTPGLQPATPPTEAPAAAEESKK